MTRSRTRSCSMLPTAAMIRFGRAVGVGEVAAKPVCVSDSTVSFVPRIGRPSGMALPEALGEQLVDEVVGRVLDHLDLFEDHLLLALDVVVR